MKRLAAVMAMTMAVLSLSGCISEEQRAENEVTSPIPISMRTTTAILISGT